MDINPRNLSNSTIVIPVISYFLGLWQLYQHLWPGEPPSSDRRHLPGTPTSRRAPRPRATLRCLRGGPGEIWPAKWGKPMGKPMEKDDKHDVPMIFRSSKGGMFIFFRFFVIRQPSRSNIHMFKNKKEVTKTTGHRPVNRSFWKKKRGFLQEKLKTLGFSRPSSHFRGLHPVGLRRLTCPEQVQLDQPLGLVGIAQM